MLTGRLELSSPEQRVLVLAPSEQDATLASEVLSHAGADSLVCRDMEQLCSEIRSGAAAVLTTDEVLRDGADCLVKELEQQPAWSDVPVLVLTDPTPIGERVAGAVDHIGNAMLLERPLKQATLISAVRTALRARRRQYQIRQHLRERDRAEDKLRMLAETGSLLSSSLNLETTLGQIADLMVPRWADWCSINLAGGDGDLNQVAIAHSDAAMVQWARELERRRPLKRNERNAIFRVLDTGAPEIYEEISDEMLVESAEDEQHLEILRKLNLRSVLIVPLQTNTQTLGVITLVYAESDRRYTAGDLSLVEELAQRCALAVENAKLYRDAQRELAERKAAEAALRRSEEKFRASVENLLDCFGFYSAIRDETGRIVDFRVDYVNRAACASTKLPTEKHVGRTLLEVSPAYKENGLLDEYARLVETGEPLVKEMFTYEYVNGVERIFDISASRLGDGFVASWRDVSDRKRADRALRELNIRLEQRVAELDAVVESIPDAVFLYNSQGITLCNSQALDVFGLDSLDEVESSLAVLAERTIPRDPRTGRRLDLAEQHVERALRGQPTTEDILIRQLSTGEDRVLRCAAAPIRLSGTITGAVAVMTDMTDRNKVESDLRHHQERLQAALEASGTGTFRWDAINNVSDWDENLCRIFNVEPGEVRTLEDFFALIHPVDRPDVIADMEKSHSKLKSFDREYRIIWKDGSVHWISDKGRFVLNEHGVPLHLVGACVDITQRKKAEETLMHEHALVELERSRLRAVLDILPMGVFIADSNGKLLETNAIARVLWGGETPLTLSKDGYQEDYKAWWPDTGQRVRSEEWGMTRALNGEIVTAEEMEIETFVGQRKTILNYALPIRNSAGNIVGAVAVNVDITARKREEQERKRLEAQFQHAQKMESLGILAGGVAHDFNNLLVGILGNAGMALAEVSPESDVHEYLRGIEMASRRAADLCRQMLAYSGKGRFFVEEVNLNLVVKEMADLLLASISKKAYLQFEPGENLPAIEADATQVRQVIMNLITNASEATMEKGGSIIVSTGQMYCDRQFLSQTLIDEYIPEGVYAYVRVADTGEGMDEETAARIFDPFFTTKFTGRGLGLAAVLGIVRGHHGAMQVHSEVGVGSTFTVYFPALSRLPRQQESAPEAPRMRKMNGTILLVDDSDTVRAVAGRMLENAGFTVLMATDGLEGVEMFRRHHEDIDCVLLDLTMPRMDGEEAFHEIRKIDKDACVVLSTGYNEQESLLLFEGQHLNGFVQKPYQATELVNRIQDVVFARRNRVASATTE